jgi:hypothetical protein
MKEIPEPLATALILISIMFLAIFAIVMAMAEVPA